MHLVRADALAALVSAIDHAIDDRPPKPPTPILIGATSEFPGFVSEDTTLMRHVTPGGVTTVRNVPSHLLTFKVRARYYDLFTAIEEAELTPGGCSLA